MPDKNQIGYRPTWAEINLRNLAYNFQQIKKLLGPKHKIMVTVKADAYGHGLIPVAKKLISCGVDYLGTASIDEGIKLRKQNIRAPILVLGMFLEKDIAPLFRYKLIPAVCTEDLALALNKRAKELGKPIDIHIKVDTGMGRLGVLHTEAFEFVKKIYHLKFINIQGIFTHFPWVGGEKNFPFSQINFLPESAKGKWVNMP